jgi:hypothetical protein
VAKEGCDHALSDIMLKAMAVVVLVCTLELQLAAAKRCHERDELLGASTQAAEGLKCSWGEGCSGGGLKEGGVEANLQTLSCSG